MAQPMTETYRISQVNFRAQHRSDEPGEASHATATIKLSHQLHKWALDMKWNAGLKKSKCNQNSISINSISCFIDINISAPIKLNNSKDLKT